MQDSQIIKPVSELDAQYKLIAQATYYKDFVRVYIPNSYIYKLLPGMEQQNQIDYISNPTIPAQETDIERSLRRTRKTIKDYVFCNDFDLFATFTMAHDRDNPELVKQRMIYWVQNERKRKGKFEYLFVPEYHKDKKSLHFHALIKGYKGQIKQSYTPDGKPIKQKGRPVFEFPSYTHGFTNVKKIDQDRVSATKVGFYLQKYITKDIPLFFGKNRYWASHGLQKPVVEDNPQTWYLTTKPDREYENDYGKIIEIDRGTSPIVDMFINARNRRDDGN